MTKRTLEENQPSKNHNKPVVLIGLMGAGKSTIGGLIAGFFSCPFFDSDVEVEKRAGLRVSDIFAQRGESAFRTMEREVLSELLAKRDDRQDLSAIPCVIATGGGAVMNPDTAALIRSKSFCIWLKADVDTLCVRTAANEDRPLLRTGNPRDILSGLIELRYPVYESVAHVCIEVDGLSVLESFTRVLDSVVLSSLSPEREEKI